MGHVFISYKTEDAEFAATLIRQIEGAGFQVWVDHERRQRGEQWREAIDQAIRDAFALVVMLTPASVESEQIKYEWTFALGVGIRVILVVLQPTDLPPRLKGLPRLDFHSKAELPWGQLIRQVQDAQNSARRPSPDPLQSRPGPFPFRRPDDAPPAPGGLLDRVRRGNAEPDIDPDNVDASLPDAVERLIKALESDNRDARVAAARRLAEVGDRAAVPGLIKLLRDDDWRVRDAAAQALGRMKAAGAVLALLEALRFGRPGPFGGGTNDRVVLDAICEIGALAVPVLVDALEDDDWRIRHYAVDAMGQIASGDCVPALIDALRDPEWRVRWRAAEALGELADASAVADLGDMLRDESRDVRTAAAWALGKIGNDLAVPGLIKLLRDRDWRVRWAAAEALWQIGQPAIPALLDVLREKDEYVRRVASRALAEIGQAAVPELVKMLGDADWDARWAAAAALQDMRDLAVPALVEALKNDDWQVSWAAAETLKRIGTPEAVQAFDEWQAGQPSEQLQPGGQTE